MGQGQGIVAHTHLGAGEAAGSHLRGQHTGLQATQAAAGKLDQIIVLDAASSGQNDARSLVVGLDVVGQIGLANGPK